jgi:hypothetical protein
LEARPDVANNKHKHAITATHHPSPGDRLGIKCTPGGRSVARTRDILRDVCIITLLRRAKNRQEEKKLNHRHEWKNSFGVLFSRR